MSYTMDVAVDWGKRGNYIAKHGMAVTDVNEALADPDRVVLAPDPKSTSGRSLRIIGYSPAAGTLITVITLPHDGITYGVNAWKSNSTDRRLYREGKS